MALPARELAYSYQGRNLTPLPAGAPLAIETAMITIKFAIAVMCSDNHHVTLTPFQEHIWCRSSSTYNYMQANALAISEDEISINICYLNVSMPVILR